MIGQRLAFEPARGRLWVICRKCSGWNLTPLEERWEAIEECERRFSTTTRRLSTENVGLAQLEEGLELVRIGRRLRPEFAAWRYGDLIVRRRRRHNLISTAGGVAASAAAAFGFSVTAGWLAYARLRDRKAFACAHPETGRMVMLRPRYAHGARLIAVRGGTGWMLRVQSDQGQVDLSDAEALRVAAVLFPRLNPAGGRREVVTAAVRRIEHAGGPEEFFRRAAQALAEQAVVGRIPSGFDRDAAELTLALEIAAQEESERRALEGELWILERAWKEAAEIAAIADDLLLSKPVEARLARLLSGRDDLQPNDGPTP